MNDTIDLDGLMERTFTARTLHVRVTSRAMRGRWQRQLAGHTRVHLGCGPHPFEGWANLDLGGGPDVVPYDLTGRLPFRDASVDRVFTEHFIEHVPRRRGDRVLSECARILKPGGVLRVSTPDLRRLVEAYLAGDTDEWADQGWRPSSPSRMLNEGLRLWGHKFVYDEAELTMALRSAGFSAVVRVPWRESVHDDLRDLERRSYHGDLILEATL
jgi:predicted SAM-dependent methyltransferase